MEFFDGGFHAYGRASTLVDRSGTPLNIGPTRQVSAPPDIGLVFSREASWFLRMTFIGRVSNGIVVLPPDVHLSEGEEVEVRPVTSRPRARTGRELAAIWATKPRLPADEAESFARDIEDGRALLNRPPVPPVWE
ncbi:MAG: hypothetical protein ACREH8_04780 [Opitutaceae bacterium]